MDIHCENINCKRNEDKICKEPFAVSIDENGVCEKGKELRREQ